jgi:proteasome lid subunit RPN8/RPN11
MKINEMIIIEYQEDIKLQVSKEILNELKKCVQVAYPNEACGIVFGEISQIPNEALEDDYFYYYTAKKFSCIRSDKKSMVAFLIKNIEQLHQTIVKAMSELDIKKQTRLISIFHSHPSGNRPSSSDIENMRFLNEFSNRDHKFISKAFKNLIWLIMDGSSFDLNGSILILTYIKLILK